MLPPHHVSLPLPQPIDFIDATLRFTIQLILAQHPDLLTLPDEPHLLPPPGLRAARHILNVIRELHYALDTYRALLPDTLSPDEGITDDIPF
jgi:hypothetical protein